MHYSRVNDERIDLALPATDAAFSGGFTSELHTLSPVFRRKRRSGTVVDRAGFEPA